MITDRDRLNLVDTRPVSVIQHRLRCVVCEDGYLEHDGSEPRRAIRESEPDVQWRLRCSNPACGKMEWSDKLFPFVTYEPEPPNKYAQYGLLPRAAVSGEARDDEEVPE